MPRERTHVRTAYVSLWLPLASETFIYYEAEALYDRGFPVSGFSLYGPCGKDLGPRLRRGRLPVEPLGAASFFRICAAVLRGIITKPRVSVGICRDIVFRRRRDAEQQLENTWAALCGFYLAERCEALNIGHLHAAWACGPATAAWTASRLTGIPFSMNCLAGDIRPPDGALAEKLQAAVFARVDASHNLPYLAQFDPAGAAAGKHLLIYNVCTLPSERTAEAPMRPPLRLLAVGRLVETKGFQYAVEALKILLDGGLEAELTVAGSGPWERKLKQQARASGVEARTHFPGFVAHDDLPELLLAADVFLMPCCLTKAGGKGDGLPTVIMEALSHGLPVISTPVSGVGDVIRHGETGLLVPERDADALADAVRALASDRLGALRMATRGRALVKEMFDTDANLKRLAALFDASRAQQGNTEQLDNCIKSCRGSAPDPAGGNDFPRTPSSECRETVGFISSHVDLPGKFAATKLSHEDKSTGCIACRAEGISDKAESEPGDLRCAHRAQGPPS
ncbi:MAG: glycosyltransferase family 4 protein [Desulfovibrio sp.]|nr:glycosyltransferase family 4 protein [Desulfovibrio sp.]